MPADRGELARTLADAELVVVENLCSLPLNLKAARTAADVLTVFPGRVVFHHHDLAWERPEFATVVDLPPALPGSLHVAISDRARTALEQRGIPAVTIRNAFDHRTPAGDRFATRELRGFDPEDFVVVQPTRAIPRKEVGAGLRLAEQLAVALPDSRVRYWITGPAEDGYGPALERILEAAEVSVSRGRTERAADLYAAADLVVVPSSWEGFGNPVVEAMIAERPVACARYLVLEELLALGLRVLPVGDVEEVAAFVRHPDPALLARNHEIAARELSVDDLPDRLAGAFAQVGWDDW